MITAERHDLHMRTLARANQKNIPYRQAFSEVLSEQTTKEEFADQRYTESLKRKNLSTDALYSRTETRMRISSLNGKPLVFKEAYYSERRAMAYTFGESKGVINPEGQKDALESLQASVQAALMDDGYLPPSVAVEVAQELVESFTPLFEKKEYDKLQAHANKWADILTQEYGLDKGFITKTIYGLIQEFTGADTLPEVLK